MAKRKGISLNVIIDKLTNSIENVITGDSFSTDIRRLTIDDLKIVTKKKGWVFNWREEFQSNEREVYKLTIASIPFVIQGLICLESRQDHIYMHLVESAPFNKGNKKIYAGVPGNLVAFACRYSFKCGYEGNVSFISKTQLIEHYIKTLGAFHFGGRVMIIDTHAASILVNKYFKK